MTGREWDSTEGRNRALLGGAPEMRVRFGRASGFAHPLFLDPVRHPEHADGLRSFVSAAAGVQLEIGTGKGRFLTELAAAAPRERVVGIEVKVKYCALALARLDKAGVPNARVVVGDARHLLLNFFPEGSVSALFLLFPDPWWKARHFRRRLLDPAFMPVLASRLREGATVLVRSDVPMVLELARNAFLGHPGFVAGEPGEAGQHQTDREVVCGVKGIAVDQVCFRKTLA